MNVFIISNKGDIIKKFILIIAASIISYSKPIKPNKILTIAKSQLGKKYILGGNGKKGLDCSGFTKLVFKKLDVNLPRTARQQFNHGKKIKKHNIKNGDLIFFSDSSRDIGHVGIVLNAEKNLMIHASSAGKKVIITNYNKTYYNNHFKGIRRLAS